MKRKEPMSKVDTAWLRMERAVNLMMITGVLMFDEPLDLERFKRLLAERFLAFPRFRQKAVDTPSGAFWQYDDDFDLNWHVRRIALPGKGDQNELQEIVSQLASTPLDHSKPLWQFHVIERFGQGSAIVTRIHHCYADGIALIQVLLSLTDAKPTAEEHAHLTKVWLKEDRGNVIERLLQPAQAGFNKMLKAGEKALDAAMHLLQDPDQMALIAREGSAIAKELAQAIALPDDPFTRLKGNLGVMKRVAWMDPIPLDDVKAVSRALDCTVNDVLLASAAGALRSYLLDLGDEIEGLTVRATVPVNLRPLEHAKKLGNHFGLVFLDLPIGEGNPIKRLERVAQNMRELKKSRQAIMAFGLLAALGMGPSALQRPALELFSRKATAVATNVPGPQMPLYFAGKRIREMMFWVPQTGSIGVGISILSYNNKVYFGLITDKKLVPNPDEVIARFRPEFEKLVYASLMEEWDNTFSSFDAEQTLRFFLGEPMPSREPKAEAPGARVVTPTPANPRSRAPANPRAPKPATTKRPATAATPLDQRSVSGQSQAKSASKSKPNVQAKAPAAGLKQALMIKTPKKKTPAHQTAQKTNAWVKAAKQKTSR